MLQLLKKDKTQDPFEEKLNFYSHFVAVWLALGFLIAMIIKADSGIAIFASALYGFALLLSYVTSSLYHIVENPSKKHILRIFDHSAIYILIAGSYTPIALLKLADQSYMLLIVEWAIALFGIGLKIFFTGRFQIVSVVLYLLMGWILMFNIEDLKSNLDPNALDLIIYGGIAYTIGVLFYSLKKIRFTHFIWHLFVLAGAVFHFYSIYLYVL